MIEGYMNSIGYGEYGEDSLLDMGLNIVKGAAKGLTKGVLKTLFNPVEISEPTELKGAKLSKGFKIIKEGDKFKITLDLEGLDTPIPAELLSNITGTFVAEEIPDIKKEHTIELADLGTIKYIPPPFDIKKIAIIGIVVVVIVFLLLKFK